MRWSVPWILLFCAQHVVWADNHREETLQGGLPPTVGERLEFSGRWLGLPVGSGWIEVKEAVILEGTAAIHIELQGHSNKILSAFYPIHDVVHSYLDAKTLRPLRFEKRQREGHYRADEVVTFDHAARVAYYRSLLNNSEKQIPLTDHVHDLVSTFYWLRTQPVRPGELQQLTIYTDEKLYDTQLDIGPLATLELLKRGTFRCFKIEPKASFKGFLITRGRLWAYMTADRRRLPVLIQATTPWGQMSAVLKQAALAAGSEE